MEFDTSEAAEKYRKIKRNLFAICMIDFKCCHDVASMLRNAKLDGLVISDLPAAYHELIGEFYCNIIEQVNKKSGHAFFITTVKGRPLLVDEELIRKLLQLPSNQPKWNVLEADPVVFNKNNFHAYLKVLCACDHVPADVFESEVLLCSDYFCPDAQFLALIYRSNIMPRIPLGQLDKWFNYADVKFMAEIMLGKLKINVPYNVVSQMLKASQLGYFAYGMFLTKLFKYFEISLAAQPRTPVISVISVKNIKFPVPLIDFIPYGQTGKKVDKMELRETSDQKASYFISKLDEIKSLHVTAIEDLKGQVALLVSQVSEQCARINMLEAEKEQRKGDDMAIVVHQGSVSVPVTQVTTSVYSEGYLMELPESAPNFQDSGMEMFVENSQMTVEGSYHINELALAANMDFLHQY